MGFGTLAEKEKKIAPTKTNLLSNEQRINNIELCMAKLAIHLGGNAPRIIKEFGLKEYVLKDSDMRGRLGNAAISG